MGPLIDELLDKFFHQGGKRHAQQWQSWLDAASGKDGATALRTKLKVLQACASPQPVHQCQRDASPPSQPLSIARSVTVHRRVA